MMFEEIIKGLRSGKRYRRACWDANTLYIKKNADNSKWFILAYKSKGFADVITTETMLGANDIIDAFDWEEVQ